MTAEVNWIRIDFDLIIALLKADHYYYNLKFGKEKRKMDILLRLYPIVSACLITAIMILEVTMSITSYWTICK